MFKKILTFLSLLFFLTAFNYSFATNSTPDVNCIGLPGCESTSVESPKEVDISDNIGKDFLANTTSYLIQIVSVFAVFALIFSGVLYLTSSGDDEKVAKAKKWIIWSLAGVFLSISAWSIIEFINGITINN